MKKKSLSRHSNTTLNLTPHYKANLFDSGGPFANMTTAGLWDDSTKATLNNTGGEGSVSGVFAGVEGMLESGLQNAKLKSTYNIQRNIADNFGLALSNQNLNTNDQLMEAWDQYNPMSHISRKDIRGGSTLGRLWNTNMASIKGAEAGWNTGGGPWGAIIGGVVGLGTGIAGWVTGGRKASRLRDRLNNEIDIANEFGYQSLANQQANVEKKNLLRAEGNYVAYGGPLDKRLAGHQMQDIYGNGIPSANRFAPGGNMNITITPNVYTGSDISRLLPYIQKAKAMREEQQLLKEQEQQPIPIRREVQIPEPSAKYTYTPPTEETKQQMHGYVPSDELIDSILKHEGYLPKPSNKLDGIWTIGYGDTDKELNDYYRAHPNEIFPEEEARKRAANRIRTEFLGYAEKYTPNWDKLTGPQKDAIISYIYNVGPGSFKNKHPKLQKALREMNLEEIAANMSAGYYDKSKPGLRKRRDFERLAFYYPEMTTYGVIPEGVTRRSFEPNDSPANKLRYETLKVKQPKTGTVPAIYTKEYLNTMPDENSVMQRGAAIWGFANGGNLFEEGGPDGKNKDYDYINNKLTPYFYNNPSAFWADTPEASNVRQWLYNNYPKQIEEYYANTPEEIRSKIPAKMLSTNIKAKNVKAATSKAINNFGKDYVPVMVTAPMLAEGLVTAPLATIGGAAGGIAGDYYGKKLDNYFGFENPYLQVTGSLLGGLAGGLLPAFGKKIFHIGTADTQYVGIPDSVRKNTKNIDTSKPYDIWTSDSKTFAKEWALNMGSEGYNPLHPGTVEKVVIPKYFGNSPKILRLKPIKNNDVYNWSELPYKIKDGKIITRTDGYRSSESLKNVVNKNDNPVDNYHSWISEKYDGISPSMEKRVYTDDIVKAAKKLGYDGVKIPNVTESNPSIAIHGKSYDPILQEIVIKNIAKHYKLPETSSKWSLIFKDLGISSPNYEGTILGPNAVMIKNTLDKKSKSKKKH